MGWVAWFTLKVYRVRRGPGRPLVPLVRLAHGISNLLYKDALLLLLNDLYPYQIVEHKKSLSQ